MTRAEPTPRSIQGMCLGLMFGNTLAASLIWGIDTIFLLDAGLPILEAFTANAFFTAGMVVFGVPTGIVADTAGRRLSYLLGTVSVWTQPLLGRAADVWGYETRSASTTAADGKTTFAA